MKFPCYLIDYSGVKETTVFQRQALHNLIDDKEDVYIYIKLADKVYKIGGCSEQKIEEIIDIYKNYIVDEECHIWKYKSSEERKEIKGK